jgi:hypothetical protein
MDTKCLEFDGTSYATAASWKPTVFTIEFDVKPISFDTLQSVFSSQLGGNEILINIQDGGWAAKGIIGIECWTGAAYESSPSINTITLNVWTHIAWSYNSSTKKWKIYIGESGVPDNSGTHTNALQYEAGSGAIVIGDRTGALMGDGARLKNLRLWSTERTGQQIAANCRKDLTGSESGLYGYYKFENNLNDSASTPHNATDAVGGLTFATDVPDWSARTPIGGVITTDGDYTIQTFTDPVGTFTTFNSGNVEILVVAGGGAGGSGGGGAGGVLYDASYGITAKTYDVLVGAGGTGSYFNTVGENGDDSEFDTLTAVGGGGGGANLNGVTGYGANGGSGGGAGASGTETNNGGTGVASPRQGYDGGKSYNGSPTYPSGSGGGAGGNATDSSSGTVGAVGAGVVSTIYDGTNITYAVGGAGILYNAGTDGSSGTAYRGNGGGGGASGHTGGNGGSGIVIIRYLTTDFTGAIISPFPSFKH